MSEEQRDALEAVDAVVNTRPVRRKKNFFEKNMIPLKGDSKNAKRRKGIFDSCVLIIFVCILVLSWVLVIDPARARRLEAELNALYYSDETETVTEPPSTEPPAPGSTHPPTTSTGKAKVVRQSHEKLKARNDNYIGWLKAPGAGIDMPIVQTANNDYYLKRDFNRNPSKYGNPFVDHRVSFDPMSTNLIIYGHHMNNGTIFSYLSRYKQPGTVKNNPIITLEMADGSVRRYKIVSVLAINGRAQEDNGYVFAVNTPDFSGEDNFNGYVRQIKQRSYVDTGVDVVYGDKLISLQTCIYDFEYEFLYVIGRELRPGESASIASVKASPNPRFPQALYDKQKKSNPYANAEIWLP